MNLPIYYKNGLLILPEAKFGERPEGTSPVVYTYYGSLADNFKNHSEMLNASEMDFKIRKKLKFKSAVNQIAVRRYKKLRDWKKYFD